MPLPAILVPRFHLLPNDSEIKQRNNPPPPVSSISAGFGSLDTKITPQAPYISQGAPPTPQQCSYGARPMVLCTRSLGKECHPLSGYTGARHCKYWCWNRQGPHFAATSAPSPFTTSADGAPFMAMPIVPTWKVYFTGHPGHQQTIIRLKHSTWHISPFGNLWSWHKFDFISQVTYISHSWLISQNEVFDMEYLPDKLSINDMLFLQQFMYDRGKIGLIALHSNFMNLGLFMLNTVSSSWFKIMYVCPRQMYYNC